MTTTKTFTSTSLKSTHGTRKAAQAAADSGNAYGGDTVKYTVEHTGPRLFAVIRTQVVTSAPTAVNHILNGEKIVCDCGSDQWYYTGRSLFSLDYECASCGRKISPPSETGACQ